MGLQELSVLVDEVDIAAAVVVLGEMLEGLLRELSVAVLSEVLDFVLDIFR